MDKERYARGLEIRRKVMSDAFVDKAFAEADDFTKPVQDLVTEFA